MTDTPFLRLLIQARMGLAGMVKDAGGCDHAVGICLCGEARLIDGIDWAIAEDLPAASFVAEFRSAAEPHERKEWAASAANAIAKIARDAAAEEEEEP